MKAIINIIILLAFIWMIIGMIIPGKAAPFFGKMKRLKIIGTTVVIWIIILLVSMPLGYLDSSKEPVKPKLTELQQQLTEKGSMTIEQAKTIEKSLNEVGLQDITLDSLDSTGATFKAGNVEGMGLMDYKNGILETIVYKGKYLYENGKKTHDISEYTVKSEERFRITEGLTKSFKENAKDPDSIKLDGLQFSKDNGTIFVTGKVRGKNSFNAIVTQHFDAKVVNNTITDLKVSN